MKQDTLKVGVASDTDPAGYGSGAVVEALQHDILEMTKLGGIELSTEINPQEWLAVSNQVFEHMPQDPESQAQFIINQITTRARLESQLGRDYAVLMSLGFEHYESPGPGKILGYMEPEWLRGTAKIVWDHCVKSSENYPNHQPSLEYWADSQATASGFNIVIHFPPSTKVAPTPYEQLADTVIEQIPTRAMLESLVGRTYSILMGIPKQDIDRQHVEHHEGLISPEMLCGQTKQVFDFCRDNNLHPTLEYWDDGKGDMSGYNVVIHWLVNESKPQSEQPQAKET